MQPPWTVIVTVHRKSKVSSDETMKVAVKQHFKHTYTSTINYSGSKHVSPQDGIIGQLTEAFAHTSCSAQVLLQQVREDL